MNFNGYLTAVTCGYSIVSPIVPISKLILTLAPFGPEHKY